MLDFRLHAFLRRDLSPALVNRVSLYNVIRDINKNANSMDTSSLEDEASSPLVVAALGDPTLPMRHSSVVKAKTIDEEQWLLSTIDMHADTEVQPVTENTLTRLCSSPPIWECFGKNDWLEPALHQKRCDFMKPLIHYYKFLTRCLKKLGQNGVDIMTSVSPVVVFLQKEIHAVSNHLASVSLFTSEQWTDCLAHFDGWTNRYPEVELLTSRLPVQPPALTEPNNVEGQDDEHGHPVAATDSEGLTNGDIHVEEARNEEQKKASARNDQGALERKRRQSPEDVSGTTTDLDADINALPPAKRARTKQPDRNPALGVMATEELISLEHFQSLEQDDSEKSSHQAQRPPKSKDSVRGIILDHLLQSMKEASSHVPQGRDQQVSTHDGRQVPVLELVTGEQAVEEIRQASTGKGSSLLVITSDASSDGFSSGIAAVLRQCASLNGGNGKNEIAHGTVLMAEGSDAENRDFDAAVDSTNDEEPWDGIFDRKVTSHKTDEIRVVTDILPYDNSNIAETEAIVMGMREAKQKIPKERRQRIIILTDSRESLKRMRPLHGLKGLDPRAQSVPKRKAVHELLQETPLGIGLCYIRSNHSRHSGFFDHEAADLLSAAARNKHIGEQCAAAHPLGERDLEWLRLSSMDKRTGSKHRKSLCKARMERELCIRLT